MRPLRILICILIAGTAMFLSGCAERPVERDKTTVLIYIAGDNNLSFYAPDCIDQLKQGFIPSDSLNSDNLLIYYDIPGECPTLFKLVRTADGSIRQNVLVSYPQEQLSATAATLNRVINDAAALCPAKYNALVLWSHATGFLPSGYYEELWYGRYDSAPAAATSPLQPQPRKTFGKDYDSDREIELVDLASCIPFKFDYIFFDSCLMGCVEAAYELRDKCDYLVVSPTEIMAQGMPYYMMMDELFNNRDKESVVKAVAEEYYNYYCTHTGGCTIVALRQAQMEALANVMAQVISDNRDQIALLNRNVLQHYDRCDINWMYDLDQIVSLIAPQSQYLSFKTALDNAIVYKAATQKFLEISINHFGGLGMYLPIEDAPKLNYHYKKLAWNKAVLLVK